MHIRWDCLCIVAIYMYDSIGAGVQVTAHDLICRMGLLYIPTGTRAHHGGSRSPRRADWAGGVRRTAMLNALHVCGFILLTAALSPSACNKQRVREILYIVADKIAKSEPRPGVAHLGERGTRQK